MPATNNAFEIERNGSGFSQENHSGSSRVIAAIADRYRHGGSRVLVRDQLATDPLALEQFTSNYSAFPST